MAQEDNIRVPSQLKRRAAGALAVGLTATALAIPGAAAGFSSTGEELAGPRSASTPPTSSEQTIVTRRDGSRAVPFVADVSGTAPAVAVATDSGFNWGDAAIGAATALGIVALLGASGYAFRSRRRIAPSTG